MLGPDASAQDIADLRTRLGLDQSLAVQYFYYIGQMLKGDLGQSIFLNMPVTTALLDRAEPTFFLTLFSLLIASVIALPIGIYAAYRRGSFVDQAATTVAMLAASIPSFWLGLILMQFFAVRLNLFPVSGYGGLVQASSIACITSLFRLSHWIGVVGIDPPLHPRINARCAW